MQKTVQHIIEDKTKAQFARKDLNAAELGVIVSVLDELRVKMPVLYTIGVVDEKIAQAKTDQRAIGAFGGCCLSFGLMAGICQNEWLLIPAIVCGLFYFIFRNK
jgi:hypothetical protein